MAIVAQNPGKRDRRIALEYRVDSRNAAGSFSPTWTHIASFWAEWLPRNGREFFSAQAKFPEISGIFRAPFVEGVDATYRLTHGSQQYEIIYVEEVGRRNAMDLIVVSATTPTTPTALNVFDTESASEEFHALVHTTLPGLLAA